MLILAGPHVPTAPYHLFPGAAFWRGFHLVADS